MNQYLKFYQQQIALLSIIFIIMGFGFVIIENAWTGGTLSIGMGIGLSFAAVLFEYYRKVLEDV